MEGRIRQLEADPRRTPRSWTTVEAGQGGGRHASSTSAYEGDDDDDAERYLFGHIEERHEDLDVISPGSPLGEALHRRRGRRRRSSYEAPGGVLEVEIVARRSV